MRPSDLRRLRGGVLRWRSYRSLLAMVGVFAEPVEALRRYVDADHGAYPWTTTLRTPLGRVRVTLPHEHDVRTVNEVFCRHDYGIGRGAAAPRVIVDVGGNIGISALYFLTRRPDARVHVWEPVPANLTTLRANLAPYADRVTVHERALAPTAGPARFLVEPVGRYSGLAEHYEHNLEVEEVTVECDAVADALRSVVDLEGRVDLLKIDTEGSEPALVAAVPDDLWAQIGEARYEEGGRVVRRHTPQSSGPPAT